MNSLRKFDNEILNNGIRNLAGVDEAGRGPLAGPVVAAAVIFDKTAFHEKINDSKKISELQRKEYAEWIRGNSIAYGYGIVDQYKIDEINILQATLLAMKSAVEDLKITPDFVVVDGNKVFYFNKPVQCIIKGDSKSFSIAAASILAKVKRDELMEKASEQYPHYNWIKNKGYGTKEHISAIRRYGYTELHRKTFLKKILQSNIQEELI